MTVSLSCCGGRAGRAPGTLAIAAEFPRRAVHVHGALETRIEIFLLQNFILRMLRSYFWCGHPLQERQSTGPRHKSDTLNCTNIESLTRILTRCGIATSHEISIFLRSQMNRYFIFQPTLVTSCMWMASMWPSDQHAVVHWSGTMIHWISRLTWKKVKMRFDSSSCDTFTPYEAQCHLNAHLSLD